MSRYENESTESLAQMLHHGKLIIGPEGPMVYLITKEVGDAIQHRLIQLCEPRNQLLRGILLGNILLGNATLQEGLTRGEDGLCSTTHIPIHQSTHIEIDLQHETGVKTLRIANVKGLRVVFDEYQSH